MVLAASSAGLSLTAFVDKCNPPTVWATQHSTTLGTVVVLTRIYCWVVVTALLFRHDLPSSHSFSGF